ncbi:hypothetical protein SEA_NANOSMITE_124 [Mycobacterium phage Nanosmite]|nr:hypothetical protein SEA_NANOSMITE_124 [Mycobacterium phage Nanosmite]
MASKSTRSRRRFLCADCGVDTGKINEFYFIRTDLWLSVMPSIDGMLCVGCIEIRLGRRLVSTDFTNASINSLYHGRKSDRLVNRLRSTAWSRKSA